MASARASSGEKPSEIRSRTRISRWNPNSSRTSSSTGGRHQRPQRGDFPVISVLQEDVRYGGGELRPLLGNGDELPPALWSEAIDLRAAAEFRHAPFSRDPSPLLHAIERGIHRAFFDGHDGSGGLLEPPRDGIAVARSLDESLEDDHLGGVVQHLGHCKDNLGNVT